jgi:hypothetical protein
MVNLGEQKAAGWVRRAGEGGVKYSVTSVTSVTGGAFWLVLKAIVR